MKKAMKKKLVTLGLVCMMTAGVRTAVFADEVPAENEVSPVEHVTKHFEMAEGIAAPDVTFSFTAAKVTSDAPNAVIRDLTYTSSDAAVATNGLVSLDKTTEITFEEFPHAGLYEYTVKETAGTENDVTYDTASYDLKVYVVNGTDGELYVQSITAEKDGAKQDDLAFVNTYCKNSSLTISKTTEGALADKTKDFEFTIRFEKAATEADNVNSYSGKIMNGTNETGETVECQVGQETSFQLHDGESLVFDSLPAGTRYVAAEDAASDGYTPSIKVVENGVVTRNDHVSEDAGIASSVSDTNLVGENDNSVAFTNTYGATPQTGIVLNNWSFILLVVLAAAAMILSKAVKMMERK